MSGKFIERVSLRALGDLFPGRYSKLIHSDVPDIYDANKSIGIEVTRASDGLFEETSAFTNEHKGRRISELSKGGRNKLDSLFKSGCIITLTCPLTELSYSPMEFNSRDFYDHVLKNCSCPAYWISNDLIRGLL